MKVIKQKSLGYADVLIYDNGIFHIHVLDKIPLSIEQAKEINELRKTLMNNKKALVLSTSKDAFVVPTEEAIEFIQSSSRLDTVKANAFVINSFSQRLAIKTAISLKKINTPIAYFPSEEKAIEWLLNIEK